MHPIIQALGVGGLVVIVVGFCIIPMGYLEPDVYWAEAGLVLTVIGSIALFSAAGMHCRERPTPVRRE